MAPGGTSSGVIGGTTIDPDRRATTVNPWAVKRPSLTSIAGSTGAKPATTVRPAVSNRWGVPPGGTWKAADEGQLAIDDEPPVGVGAGPLERRSDRAAGPGLPDHVGHRVEDREADVQATLAERAQLDRSDVQRAGLRDVAVDGLGVPKYSHSGPRCSCDTDARPSPTAGHHA